MSKPWKLEPKQRLVVLERYRSGELLKAIAYDYNITPVAIGQLAHRAGEPLRKIPRKRRVFQNGHNT